MSKFNPFDPANGYSEEDRAALSGKCSSLINEAYKNPFPGAVLRMDAADNAGIFFASCLAKKMPALSAASMQASSSPSSWRMSRPRRTIRTSRSCPA